MGIGKTTISQCSAYENIIFCWVMHEQSIIDHKRNLVSKRPTAFVRVQSVAFSLIKETLI